MSYREKMSIKKGLILSSVFILLSVFVLLSAQYLARYPDLAERYASDVFPLLTRPFVFIANLIPISMTEVFVVSAALSSPFIIVWLVYRFVKSRHKKRFAVRGLTIITAVIFCLTTIFNLFHGYNYSRYPLKKTLRIDQDTTDQSEEALVEVLEWIVRGLEESVSELDEDYNGHTLLLTDRHTMFADASEAMDIVAEGVNDAMSGHYVRPKPVALSSRWSYTQIAGMYNPFFLEANINIDIPEFRLPMVASHEIAHVRGIAQEGDANMAAFLACISSPRADFRYSGFLFAYSYIAHDLYMANSDEYFKIIADVPDRVHTDLLASAEYWNQFEGKVAEVSTQVNDSYLRINRQEEGVLSYSFVSELIVSYYHVHGADMLYD